MNFERNLNSVKKNTRKAKCLSQRSISFKSYCPDAQTHAHIGPIALRGPLNWWSTKLCEQYELL